MDQEDFEQMAYLGERPVGSLHPVFIPPSAESGNGYDRPTPYVFDDRTGRISIAEPWAYLMARPLTRMVDRIIDRRVETLKRRLLEDSE